MKNSRIVYMATQIQCEKRAKSASTQRVIYKPEVEANVWRKIKSKLTKSNDAKSLFLILSHFFLWTFLERSDQSEFFFWHFSSSVNTFVANKCTCERWRWRGKWICFSDEVFSLAFYLVFSSDSHFSRWNGYYFVLRFKRSFFLLSRRL